MLKVAIVLLLLATLVSLFSGLFFLVKDQGHGSRVVNSLTVRVVLAARPWCWSPGASTAAS